MVLAIVVIISVSNHNIELRMLRMHQFIRVLVSTCQKRENSLTHMMCFQSLVQNHCTADDQVRRLCARRVDSDPQYLHGELSLYVLLVIWFGCIQKQDSLLIRPYSPSCEPTLPDAFPSAFLSVRVAAPYVDQATPALSSPEV